uniref:Uncharacterized protein n=1 Tax=Anguilla anguilla TaxID=7936 RepID=A0A0E9XCC8_ANGAN
MKYHLYQVEIVFIPMLAFCVLNKLFFSKILRCV